MKKTIFAVMILALLTACSPTTISLTPHPAAPPDDGFLITRCATIYSFPPLGVTFKGSVVLDDYETTSNLFIKNLENGSEIPLATPSDTVADIRISPDHKRVGYQLGNNDIEWRLIIADAQGNRQTEQVWEQGFFILGNWLNNGQILMLTTPPFVALNPDTNETKDFTYSDFPDYAFDARNNRIALFDPSLEKAAYKNTNDKVSLYDIPSKKVLAEVDNHPNPTIIGAWAPDGSQVAVTGTIPLGLTTDSSYDSDDLFSITRDGQVKRLTHLADHYGKLVNISKAGVSWSPDSRFVGFWTIYPQNDYKYWELAIHDLTTDKTTNYCISNDYENILNSTHYLLPPVWSPDGKQVLVENRYDNKSSRTLILDLETNKAYQIAENMFPAGWLVGETP